MTLDTKDDRTLFFDMMPVFFKTAGGVKVKIKLYTVPGQVMHESTRRIVLQGSDAVVFVADSRKSEAAPTLAYWKDMVRNLEANGLDPRALPIVIQKNKMDLDGIREDDFADLARSPKVPVIPAKAIQGEGVLETLGALLSLCYRDLDRRSAWPSDSPSRRRSFSARSSAAWKPDEGPAVGTPPGDAARRPPRPPVVHGGVPLVRRALPHRREGLRRRRQQAGGREDRQRRLLRIPLADARRAQPVHGHRAAGEDRTAARRARPQHRPLLRRLPLRDPAGALRGGRHRPDRLRPVRSRRPGGPAGGDHPALARASTRSWPPPT